MRPHYNIRDEEVCLDIDSDERLDQRNMFTDPHKHSELLFNSLCNTLNFTFTRLLLSLSLVYAY